MSSQMRFYFARIRCRCRGDDWPFKYGQPAERQPYHGKISAGRVGQIAFSADSGFLIPAIRFESAVIPLP